jgi:hypothetical protein
MIKYIMKKLFVLPIVMASPVSEVIDKQTGWF